MSLQRLVPQPDKPVRSNLNEISLSRAGHSSGFRSGESNRDGVPNPPMISGRKMIRDLFPLQKGQILGWRAVAHQVKHVVSWTLRPLVSGSEPAAPIHHDQPHPMIRSMDDFLAGNPGKAAQARPQMGEGA
jgi:hypothetical protein